MRLRRSSSSSSETSKLNSRICSVAVDFVEAFICIPSSFAGCAQSAQRSECRSHLLREQLRLLPGGEVPAPVDLVEVAQVGVDPLRPAAWRPVDLAGEHREG